jgi:S1-C subfamily serine protease
MNMGAGGTQAQQQPADASILTLNGKPVKDAKELQAALDALAPGTAVKITYKVNGQERVIEGVAK